MLNIEVIQIHSTQVLKPSDMHTLQTTLLLKPSDMHTLQTTFFMYDYANNKICSMSLGEFPKITEYTNTLQTSDPQKLSCILICRIRQMFQQLLQVLLPCQTWPHWLIYFLFTFCQLPLLPCPYRSNLFFLFILYIYIYIYIYSP